ncbi:formate/nitrite transporter family protein [Cognatilysobacter terrigena]|uniref:formate/nitrite transporter family protein n=1 Tax=Cognatilysobacter terrigena TaxID=2488749 RepID=UPI00105D1394|nr:formate/nitrite transporter family protein [Lysobacter terrigena]
MQSDESKQGAADAEHGEPASQLTEQEARDVEEKQSPTAHVLHETIRREGDRELERSASALLWSAIAAGLSMGFSLLTPALMHARIGDTPVTPLLVAFGYSIGFMLVILGKQQLFTENTLTPVLVVMTKPTLANVGRLLRLWGLVFAGNMVGVAIFAFALARLDITDAETQTAMVRMGAKLMGLSTGQMFVRGIFAGWLIAILVWLLPAAEHSKVVLIALVTGLISFAEMTHIIAGSAETLYLVFAHITPLGDVVVRFMLPTLAGNVVGGSLIFALISHAQVRSDSRE